MDESTSRSEPVLEPDALVEAPAHAVAEGVDLLGAVVRGVDMDAERPLALGQADDPHARARPLRGRRRRVDALDAGRDRSLPIDGTFVFDWTP